MRTRVPAGRESRRQVGAGIPQEVLLLEAEPEVVVVFLDGGAAIGLVGRTVGVQDLGHHEEGIRATRVPKDRHRFQQQVRGVAFGLRR